MSCLAVSLCWTAIIGLLKTFSLHSTHTHTVATPAAWSTEAGNTRFSVAFVRIRCVNNYHSSFARRQSCHYRNDQSWLIQATLNNYTTLWLIIHLSSWNEQVILLYVSIVGSGKLQSVQTEVCFLEIYSFQLEGCMILFRVAELICICRCLRWWQHFWVGVIFCECLTPIASRASCLIANLKLAWCISLCSIHTSTASILYCMFIRVFVIYMPRNCWNKTWNCWTALAATRPLYICLTCNSFAYYSTSLSAWL